MRTIDISPDDCDDAVIREMHEAVARERYAQIVDDLTTSTHLPE